MKETKITRRSILLSGAAALVAFQPELQAQAAEKGKFHDLDHDHFMRLAIEQAKKVPDCPFGSVVVNMKTGKVEAEGWVEISKNPIWHGEMAALRNCPDSDKGFDWKNMCLYTTGESCPMCQSAIIWTRMPLVVYGSSMPFLQSCGFGEIHIRAQAIVDASQYGKCTIIGGVLAAECNELFKHAQQMNLQKS
jgi:tRNA(Arg) A34 adenosine deaminase TadA